MGRPTTETRSAPPGIGAIPPVTGVTLVIALVALPALTFVGRVLELSQPVSFALQWLVAIAVIAITVGVEDRPLSSIGFRRPAWIDLGYLLAAAAGALLVFVFTGPLVEALGLPVESGTSGLGELPGLPLAIAMAVTAGVVEEILYRGYAIERLLEYSGSALVAGGFTWLAFTLAHAVAWPLGNLLQVAAVTAIFVVVYLRRRTLVPVVGAHVLVWLLPVLGAFFA
ncbi:CPBP family intramembrane glutamic endopeptidase [Halopiger xanaduensis]|uniref:Abortive infection protein n=1 Tax=Halopiger xanaduensis (strain DSM 18323 / JCM 14033 / SH-6) TaxID=797210 RepID=F8DBF2_HALXS|nr:CPBP family intramembrane glutamic endopeptidase [Halopiger xanaduensis]AEH37067.1 Abortive infection protein [Halopiger xanaduensis SH-6]